MSTPANDQQSLEGILSKSLDLNRWAIYRKDDDVVYNTELNTGDIISVSIAGVWISVRVEHNDFGYYVSTGEESFRPFFGMRVRKEA